MIEWEKTSDRFVKHGRLIVSSGTNTSCYRSIYLPLVQLGSESFPKIVLISGVHGDEYEGPALLNRLIAKLACKQLNYCVTVVPCANPIAFASGSRLSPEDSANLASSFVRGATSGVTQVIAKLLEECVFHDAQVIIDLHAGGLSFTYTPCAVLLKTIGLSSTMDLRVVASQLGVTMGIEKSFNNSESFIASAAHRSGASYLAMELGGGGSLNVRTANIVRECLEKYLSNDAEVIAEESKSIRWLKSTNRDHYLFSPSDGLFEPNFSLGDHVEKGECAGWLHQPNFHAGQMLPVEFVTSGEVVGFRHLALAKRGDCLVETADSI